MGKIAKLICITAEKNNNKFYHMFEQTDGTFKVEYGRVESTAQHTSYQMHQWDKKFNEKVKKGYKDVTEFTTVKESVSDTGEKIDESFISNDTYVKGLISDLQRFAKATVSQNYNVSTRNVTQKMVDEAQSVVDQISISYTKKINTTELNELLLKLFTIIPRKMAKVKDYLINDGDTKETISKLIENEQSVLDTLAGQVAMEVEEPKVITETKVKTKGLLDSMGIEMSHVTDANVIAKIKKLMGDSSNLFHRAYEVKNHKADKKYNDHLSKMNVKNEELFFHGSRSENWISILQTSLLVRPTNAVITGKMFGSGIYFSSVCRKSIGYTSLSGSYWVKGNNNKAYMALFKVNVGNKKIVHKHDSSCYSFDHKTIQPFDSVYAPAGADLRNDETIVYSEEKCKIQYLIEIKN
jgi:poly [ADP-ribose] polymerase